MSGTWPPNTSSADVTYELGAHAIGLTGCVLQRLSDPLALPVRPERIREDASPDASARGTSGHSGSGTDA